MLSANRISSWDGAAWRFAHGGRDPRDIEFLQNALFLHFYDDAGIPLERRLRAPAGTKVRLQRRDDHIVRAAKHLEVSPGLVGPVACSELLASRWKQFVTRGQWRAWRDDDVPPPDVPLFYFELFFATREMRGEKRYLDGRQVRRIAGHVFRGG